jgi:hypothetical protein
MSKHNKVNPGQYHLAGRLTPDEAARERVKQRNTPASATKAPRFEDAPGPRRNTAPRAASAAKPAAGASRAGTAPRARAAGRSRS